jgi:diadenosine tetraphosphate (Ap4A) HIT family hydrolase
MTPDERLAKLEQGQNPALIIQMRSGFAVMGDFQFLPGYCLLLAYPKVEKLNDLAREPRTEFLEDMARLGDAILAATGALRINYSIYGNLDPFLHAHLFPRYEWEPPEQVGGPVWLYDFDELYSTDAALGSRHDELRKRIVAELEVRGAQT